MAKLIEDIKRNPEALAIAVLCLVLGLGHSLRPMVAMASHATQQNGVYWCPRTVTPEVFEGMPQPPALPNLPDPPNLPDLRDLPDLPDLR